MSSSGELDDYFEGEIPQEVLNFLTELEKQHIVRLENRVSPRGKDTIGYLWVAHIDNFFYCMRPFSKKREKKTL